MNEKIKQLLEISKEQEEILGNTRQINSKDNTRAHLEKTAEKYHFTLIKELSSEVGK
jgi:hypothetical protein